MPSRPHLRRRWLMLALLLLTPALGFAQTPRFDVSGVVTDTLDTGLAGATVVVLQAADSVLVRFGVTRPDGAFRLRRVPSGDYILQVTFVGFAPYSNPIRVGEGDLDVGQVHLQEEVAALSTLVITAEHVPMLIDGDTLEYNAAAFGVRPNANVEELLKRLPGVEVERDGSIKAQGEQVQQVLVDGKEFFGDDPRIATQNLPAEAVDKVQVYDKQSDMAEFTGIDDGEESKTINLALKEDHKQGYFGNVGGGFGGDGGNGRYDGKASVNRFSRSSQFSLIGNFNNINRQGFSFNDYMNFMGGMQGMMMAGGRDATGGIPLGNNINEGFTTTTAGGINFNHDFSKQTSLRSSYFLNYVNNTQDRFLRQEQLLGADLSSLSLQDALQEGQNLNHRLNLNLKHELGEGQDVRLRASAQATDAALDNLSGRDTRDATQALVNASNTTYRNDSRTFGGNASLTYRKRLNDKGRTLVAEASARLNDGQGDANLQALNTYYARGDVLSTEELAQLQNDRNHTLTNRQRLSLTQPLGKQKSIEAHVERQQIREDQSRDIFDQRGGTDVLNDALSSALERTYAYNRAGGNLRFNNRRRMFSLGADVQGTRLQGDILDADARVEKSFVHVLPQAAFDYEIGRGKNLNLRYRTSTREPSMRELQPFTDNSDPVNVYVGNPDLSPEYSHSATAHFMLFDEFTFTNFFAFIRGTYTTNKIVQARTIDAQFRQTITAINAGDNWMVNGSFNFGTPIRPLGLKVTLTNSLMYNRGLELINAAENQTRTTRNSTDLRLENRNKDVWDVFVGAQYTFNVNRYSLNPQLDQNYINRTYYAEVTYNLGDVWHFTTGFDYRRYDADVFGTGQDIPLWRAEVSRLLMQEKAEIRLVALDLLNRNVGISFTNTATYIQEEQVNSLGRYLMLKFVYNLSGFGRDKGGIDFMTH